MAVKRPTTYFLGAGASASDELPLTNELNLAIAAHIAERDPGKSQLSRYYRQLYGIDRRKLRRAAAAWEDFLVARKPQPEAVRILPDVVETLSLIDLAIAENMSFGADLEGPTLLAVRAEISEAIAHGVKRAGLRKRAPWTKKLAALLKPGDTVITTNWDVLIDRALTYLLRKRSAQRFLRETNIDYGAVNARAVNWEARDLPAAARGRHQVLKLHGSLNWFYCARCGDLYANVELPWVIDTTDPRPDFDFCHCGVALRNIMIAPSYVKNYANAHLQSVWRHALTALRNSGHWVFIGYSLPADDYHIRAMLLRALRARLDVGNGSTPPTLDVVYRGPDEKLKARYDDLFRLASRRYFDTGMQGYLDGPRR